MRTINFRFFNIELNGLPTIVALRQLSNNVYTLTFVDHEIILQYNQTGFVITIGDMTLFEPLGELLSAETATLIWAQISTRIDNPDFTRDIDIPLNP